MKSNQVITYFVRNIEQAFINRTSRDSTDDVKNYRTAIAPKIIKLAKEHQRMISSHRDNLNLKFHLVRNVEILFMESDYLHKSYNAYFCSAIVTLVDELTTDFVMKNTSRTKARFVSDSVSLRSSYHDARKLTNFWNICIENQSFVY